MFGFFSSIVKSINSVFSGIGSRLSEIFSSKKDLKDALEQLRNLLYQNDVSTVITQEIICHIEKAMLENKNYDANFVKSEIISFLKPMLKTNLSYDDFDILFLFGINGVGKTTFSVKLANLLRKSGHKPLLVAADTFRAAAADQLQEMASAAKIDLVCAGNLTDPASVVFEGGVNFAQAKHDRMIIDTAGRLHTKVNLINEFKKMQKVLDKTNLANKKTQTWLVLDGMLGQTNITQAQTFFQSIKIDGIVLTKLDSSSKCGSILSIVREFDAPVVYVTFGNDIQSITKFDSNEFLQRFLS